MLECDMIARGLQRLDAQGRKKRRLYCRMQLPTDLCVRGTSAGVHK